MLSTEPLRMNPLPYNTAPTMSLTSLPLPVEPPDARPQTPRTPRTPQLRVYARGQNHIDDDTKPTLACMIVVKVLKCQL